MLCYLLIIETEPEKRKFEKIYLKYRQMMHYAANRILHDGHLAEDAVHKAFIRVIEHLDKINEDDHVRTKAFLTVITEHIAIDLYRKRKKENWISYEELDIYLADEQPVPEGTSEVAKAILELPVNYSAVLRLKYAQGYTDREIAEILHISEDNVRQRIARAKKKLKKALEESGVTVE
ncbi:MAG: RNA polymerase sigma factor [Lachnospiraceae bacterium]|nr:RNA polymerase sigma factor [Lachnospiraceae bacterium]